MPNLIASGSPNVWALSWWTDDANDVQYTIYRSVPGETVPRMTFSNFNNPERPVHVDCGTIENPERFGSWSTYDEFVAYVTAFVNA
jgi:hypothetical protein